MEPSILNNMCEKKSIQEPIIKGGQKMSRKLTIGLIFASFIIAGAVLMGTVSAQQEPAAQDTGPANIALVAVPSSSYVSGDTTLEALNDGRRPRNSADARRGSYGNWNRTGTQWVQYDWSQPISTNKIDVYWWADGSGIWPPKACRLLYWKGNEFVPVPNAKGLGIELNKYNTTTFDEVMTAKLRLEIDANAPNSTGILEWKVYDSGKSPDFPPTVVAGIDRVVMLGGKTYLNGTLKALSGTSGSDTKSEWSKESGPGNVTFADAAKPETTATFSAAGNYVLKLTATKGAMKSSDTLDVKVENPPTEANLEMVYPKKFKVNSPLWNQRVKALIVNWIPHCIDKNNDPNLREGGINNFIEAAKKLRGEPAKRHVGYPFSNAWVHQTVESMCIALMVDPQGDQDIIKAQQKMRETLEDWVPKILAAQEPDGYLQTLFTLNSNLRRWDARSRSEHEGYVAGYFLESATVHYLATDKKDSRMYNAAKKLADCWCNNLGPGKKEWYDGHQEMEQALVRFGRFVNDMDGKGKGDKYIQLAKFLLDCRRDGSEYDQSHLPVIQQYEAVGHAVRAVYNYSGMSDVAMETGDIDYQSAVMSLWDNIVNKKYYVTGGVGSGETSEGFGPNYSLRNEAYCEACSSCGEMFFQQKLNMDYHDAKYADLIEETMYNALLGSIDLAGKNFYYQNPLDARGMRYPWHGCPCCVGNIPRTLLMLPTWMYAKSSDTIYVNTYIGSTSTVEGISGTNVEMVQVTDYPWSGKVAITVNPAVEKKFTIKIRIPNRDVSSLYKGTPAVNDITSISVNGSKIEPKIEKGYAVIERSWKAGDKIELELPMKVQRVKADEKIAATRGKVALRYGPLIYNIESVDQDINKVLSPDSPLTTEWKKDLLEGVMVINGKFSDGSAMMAIPNYARMNRSSVGAGDSQFGGPGATGGGEGGRGRRGGGAASIVWIKDK